MPPNPSSKSHKQKQNNHNDDSQSSESPPPPAPVHARTSGQRQYFDEKAGSRSGYRIADSPKITILLCVYHSHSQGWRTWPLTFDRYRTTDQELWEGIRDVYRNELQRPWRRILLFKRLKHIEPIAFNRYGVPKRHDSKDDTSSHEFMHCYHHPLTLRTDHEWVDWFVKLRKNPDKTYGLEFIEGLWAEKLAALAVIGTLAMIIVSAVWCARGGDLQTVFTVMGFILTGLAAQIALVALYYQVTLPG